MYGMVEYSRLYLISPPKKFKNHLQLYAEIWAPLTNLFIHICVCSMYGVKSN